MIDVRGNDQRHAGLWAALILYCRPCDVPRGIGAKLEPERLLADFHVQATHARLGANALNTAM
jgi:hypothetical protein